MRFIRFRATALILGVVLSLLFATPLLQQKGYAQATSASGAIQGTVTDPTGALVPNAKVTIKEPATGYQKVLTTTSAGIYVAAGLVPGTYTVRVDATGFSASMRQVVVQVGESVNGDFKLGLKGATTEITVEESAVQVDTTGSTVEGVLNRQQIDALPLNGRNFLDMAQLQPGVQIQDGTSFDPTKNGFASISFGGRFGRTARITLDGVDISDENVGTTTQNVSEDAIQEFQIAQSSLDISTSLTSSGSVNIVTRSGTNLFHGDGFYNFRDKRAGNAEAANYTPIPGVDANYMQRNNMGGAASGPVLHDKLFFFGQYEYFRQNVFNGVVFGGPLASVNGGYPVKFHETLTMGRVDWNGPHGIRAFGRWNYNNNSDMAAFGGSNYSPFLNRDNTPGFAGGVDFAGGKFTHSSVAATSSSSITLQTLLRAEGIYNPTPGINLVINPFGYSSGANLLAPQATVQSNKQLKYDGSWIKGRHTLRYGGGVDWLRGGGYASFFGLAPQVADNVTCAILEGPNLDDGVGSVESGPFPALGSSAIQATLDGCATPQHPGGLPYNGATNPSNYPAEGGTSMTFGNGQGYFTEIPSFGFPGGGQLDDRINFYLSDTVKLFSKLIVNFGVRYVRDTGRDDEDLPAIHCWISAVAWPGRQNQ